MDERKEAGDMATPAMKPIKPTVIELTNEKEYNEFVDWAEGRKKGESPGTQRARSLLKKHKSSVQRKS